MYVKEYLKMKELKDGYLYEIIARNAKYGIWSAEKEAFLISRIKFDDNFLFEEHHYDCPAFATAQPIREIEKAPKWYEEKNILKYLNKFEGNRDYMYPKHIK